MDHLTLEVTRYTGPRQWYWRLSDGDGVPVADHEVDLSESDDQWEAFTRLGRYLGRKVSPAGPLASEAAIVERLGQWIGANAFGPIGPELVARSPATVALRFAPGLPADAEALLFRPWELAHAEGRPLARQDVSLVMIPPGTDKPRSKEPVKDSLRMLAVFSLPEAEPALVLREQRYALVRLVNEIRESHGKSVELSALQYDVSRKTLSDALADGAGWDIVHFSGHGLVDGLVLEGPEGEPDTVPAGKLIDLLWVARSRLKLLVLSSCNSAAAPPGEALAARFGLPAQDEDDAAADTSPARRPLSALAADAARRLDCGVLAMRYVVDDDFSIALADDLYRRMLRDAQPLARALQLAVPEVLGDRPRPGVPPLSVGTPALFGRRCLDLALVPPAMPKGGATGGYDVAAQRMSAFPAPPKRLVGRSGPMGSAARALRGEGPVGTVFTGPAGIGKTACAVELAYRHQDRFGALVWWPVPPRAGFESLRAFAAAMDAQLPGLKMAAAVMSDARLSAFEPRLTELMENKSVLVTIDGIDDLLSSNGYWRDPFWKRVIAALLDHSGFSRLVLTGRTMPREACENAAVEPLAPLNLQESVLLARQLPALGALIRGTGGVPIDTARRLIAESLTAANGNPAALGALDRELADARFAVPAAPSPPSPAYQDLVGRWTAGLE